MVLVSRMKIESDGRWPSDPIWPISYFYIAAKRYFHINDRMVRRYISRGLIPQPERKGRKAFYDTNKTPVWEHLQLIKLLQSRYNLSLDDIGALIDSYHDQIVVLNIKVLTIEKRYNSLMKPSPYYVEIRDRFLEKIQKDVLYLEKLDIEEIEKEIKGNKF